MEGEKKKDNLPIEEVRARINAVTEEFSRNIAQRGARFAYGLDWSGEELLQEAYQAILAGKRNWRADLTIDRFLLRSMRSLAYSRRKALRNDDIDLTQSESPRIAVAPADELDDPGRRVENAQYFGRKLERLQQYFKDDAEVTLLLTLRGLGDDQRETMEASGISAHEYKAAVKRLQRQGMKLMDDENEEVASVNDPDEGGGKVTLNYEFGDFDFKANLRSAAGYFILESRMGCLECGKDTAVFALALAAGYERLEPVEEVDGDPDDVTLEWTAPGVSALLSHVEYLVPEVALRVLELIQNYRPGLDMEVRRAIWLNHCEHCGEALAEGAVHDIDSPEGPFGEVVADGDGRAIRVVKVAGRFEGRATEACEEPEFLAGR